MKLLIWIGFVGNDIYELTHHYSDWILRAGAGRAAHFQFYQYQAPRDDGIDQSKIEKIKIFFFQKAEPKPGSKYNFRLIYSEQVFKISGSKMGF